MLRHNLKQQDMCFPWWFRTNYLWMFYCWWWLWKWMV